MKKCPNCDKWTLDYDEYFGRFRCFDADCGWMPPSAVEQDIRLEEEHGEPQQLTKVKIPDIDLVFSSSYDAVNDILMFDFGLSEGTFDLPEGDGRLVWKIGHATGSVAGFSILEARRLDISTIRINIEARKETIERILRNTPMVVSSGRASRTLIDNVEVIASTEKKEEDQSQISSAYQDAINKFKAILKRDEPVPAY
jgi:hypothetical protein